MIKRNCVQLLIGGFVFATSFTLFAQGNPFNEYLVESHEGYFGSDDVGLMCFSESDLFVGQLFIGGSSFPLEARLVEGQLRGRFRNGKTYHSFTARVDGDVMSFENDAWTGTLQRKPVPKLYGFWSSDKLTVFVRADEDDYVGTMYFNEELYPFSAQRFRGGMRGMFLCDKKPFEFEIRHEIENLWFSSGEFECELTRTLDDYYSAEPYGYYVGELAGKDRQGNEVSLSQFKGNVLVLDVWRSEHPKYSRRSLEQFSELREASEGMPIAFLGVNQFTPSDSIDKEKLFWTECNQSDFQTLMFPDAGSYEVFSKQLVRPEATGKNIYSWPLRIVVDPNGRVFFIAFGRESNSNILWLVGCLVCETGEPVTGEVGYEMARRFSPESGFDVNVNLQHCDEAVRLMLQNHYFQLSIEKGNPNDGLRFLNALNHLRHPAYVKLVTKYVEKYQDFANLFWVVQNWLDCGRHEFAADSIEKIRMRLGKFETEGLVRASIALQEARLLAIASEYDRAIELLENNKPSLQNDARLNASGKQLLVQHFDKYIDSWKEKRELSLPFAELLENQPIGDLFER